MKKAILLRNIKGYPANTEVNIVSGEFYNNDSYYYLCQFPDGDTYDIQSYFLKIINASSDNIHSISNIDWEQRRYEIAKAALHEYTRPREERYISNAEYAAIVAVEYADALIKELKKK